MENKCSGTDFQNNEICEPVYESAFIILNSAAVANLKKSSRYFHQESIHMKASCFHSNILSTKTLAEHIFRILFKMLFD